MYYKDIMIQGNSGEFKGMLRIQKKRLMGNENENLKKIHNTASQLSFSLCCFIPFFFFFFHQFPLLPNLYGDSTYHGMVNTIKRIKVFLEGQGHISPNCYSGPNLSGMARKRRGYCKLGKPYKRNRLHTVTTTISLVLPDSDKLGRGNSRDADIWLYADVKFVIKQIQNGNKVY